MYNKIYPALRIHKVIASSGSNNIKWAIFFIFFLVGCTTNEKVNFKIYRYDSGDILQKELVETSYLQSNENNNDHHYLLTLDTDSTSTHILEFDNSHTDKFFISELNEGNVRLLYETGDLIAFNNREIKHRNILVPIDRQDSIIVNIVNRGAYIIPVRYFSKMEYFHFDFIRNTWLGACLGIIVMLLLMSFIALLFSRGNKLILYYFLFGIFSFLFFLTEFGYGDVYLWSNHPQREEPMIFGFIIGSVISLLLLVFKVFHLDEGKTYWRKIQQGLLAVSIVYLITLLLRIIENDIIFEWYYNGLLLLVVLVFVFTILAGIIAISRKVSYAAYFLFAMSILIIGSLLKPVSLAGISGFNGFVQYGGVVGLMVSLMAMAVLFLVRYFDGLHNAIKLENQIIHLERSALQAQMNPHFIFNSLNSIQNYIAKNDQIKAMDYLAGFAKLVRRILNASSEKIISIEEEISMLKGYLELEKLRFKEKFEFEISIPTNIDIHRLGIPPLLIQPFVENAVIHGMKNIQERGIIIVKFTHQPPFLKVVIEDNGTGFENIQKSGHKSKGMSITRKRLEHLNKSGDELAIRIENKQARGTNETGTIVTLMILTKIIDKN